MNKNYTNLKHLNIRLPENSDVDLIKAWARDYYENNMMSKKTYDFWLNRDYNEYFKSKENILNQMQNIYKHFKIFS